MLTHITSYTVVMRKIELPRHRCEMMVTPTHVYAFHLLLQEEEKKVAYIV